MYLECLVILLLVQFCSASPVVLEKARLEYLKAGVPKTETVSGEGGGSVGDMDSRLPVSGTGKNLVNAWKEVEQTVDREGLLKPWTSVGPELAAADTEQSSSAEESLDVRESMDMTLLEPWPSVDQESAVSGTKQASTSAEEAVRPEVTMPSGGSRDVTLPQALDRELAAEGAVRPEDRGGSMDPEPLAVVEVHRNGATAHIRTEDQHDREVVFLPSLEEAELLSAPGPFNIVRVVDFLATMVEEQVLESYFGNARCSQWCGKDGVVDVMSCLACIALSQAHLTPFPVTAPE